MRRNQTKNPVKLRWNTSISCFAALRRMRHAAHAFSLQPDAWHQHCLTYVHERNMNPHACLLAVLISSGLAQSPGFPVQPPLQALRHAPPDVAPAAAHDRPSPLTRMHARRGGKGRRRGRTGISDSPRQAGAVANAVREKPSTAAALAALAVQHASHEDLLAVAYTHRAALRPGLLSQALLRLAKVSELRAHRTRVCCYERASLYSAIAAVLKSSAGGLNFSRYGSS